MQRPFGGCPGRKPFASPVPYSSEELQVVGRLSSFQKILPVGVFYRKMRARIGICLQGP
jgi:hypothetical protein